MEENESKFQSCSVCGTPDFCKKEGACSAEEYKKASIDWKAHTVSLLGELRNLNYLKENNLEILLFKHSECGKVQVCVKLMKKDKLLYIRYMEGDSDEIRYNLLYFFYMDILNQGLMMMHKLQIEQEKLEKEMKLVDKIDSATLIDLHGKKLT